jgi:hypothetical protein
MKIALLTFGILFGFAYMGVVWVRLLAPILWLLRHIGVNEGIERPLLEASVWRRLATVQRDEISTLRDSLDEASRERIDRVRNMSPMKEAFLLYLILVAALFVLFGLPVLLRG